MAETPTLGDTQTGWTYMQARTPVACVMPIDSPGDATVIAFPNWWNALRFAVTFASLNACVFVGGPIE